MSLSRKSFLHLMSVAPAGLVIPSSNSSNKKHLSAEQLGLASYTLRHFSLDQVIEIMQKLQLRHLALKSMHMPLEASEQELMTLANKVRQSGIKLYGAGVIYMKTADEVKNAFRYAKAAGLEMIIGVPNHELLDLSNALVKEYNIRLAIHNHGPGDDLYPTPGSIMNRIANLDARIGVCLDIGHVVRLGLNLISELKLCASRLYDIHLKDVNKASADGTSIEMGRGIIDLPGFLSALQKLKYAGVLGLEYEKDHQDPFLGLAECVGYSRGILDNV